jgi:putative addiction module component (TIGR02574 family)
MSKNEILHELNKLSPEDRSEIRAKLDELDRRVNDDWDDDEMTEEEKRLVEERIAEHERDPGSAIPWEQFKAELLKRYPK